uniref:Uncharacterized protein n=1 Tax=Arundo donax TaxID=35708 RepID=A0A0A9DYM6_ARUDO
MTWRFATNNQLLSLAICVLICHFFLVYSPLELYRESIITCFSCLD